MQARMIEISNFIEENVNEPKIHFFEKHRLELKKALRRKLAEIPEPQQFSQEPTESEADYLKH